MADEPMTRVPKTGRGNISLAHGIHCSAIFHFVCPTIVSTLCRIRMCVCTHNSLRTGTYLNYRCCQITLQ